ncbi:hypothetical protein BJX63DRAFT_414995 [Aspergillus granulosus]|uniref:Uncharacterized protein n=1 Tax=Aspergillus granulosus TaxID=176169 RepID=A0ABR4GTU8_9EURO
MLLLLSVLQPLRRDRSAGSRFIHQPKPMNPQIICEPEALDPVPGSVILLREQLSNRFGENDIPRGLEVCFPVDLAV